MLISYKWLCELLSPALTSPEQLVLLLTSIGHEVESCETQADDAVVELSITPNRGDCLSAMGLARELSVILKTLVNTIELPTFSLVGKTAAQVEIRAGELCPRYIARELRLSSPPGSSPDWMQERLLGSGVRPINAIVDISNYVMLELGQPLHAFDMDKVSGSIIVRICKPGEKLAALNDKEYELKESMLVIADEEKPLAIAGVIGGEESAVSASTHRILLECACFAPESIRTTARALAISTESSMRYERGIDYLGMERASARACQLLVELANAEVVGDVVDVIASTPSTITVTLSMTYAERLIGMELDTAQAVDILSRLGFTPQLEDNEIRTKVPSWRNDVTCPADLVEELARYIGYDAIPTATVAKSIPYRKHANAWTISHQITEMLTASGFYEACLPSITQADFVNKLYGERREEWCGELAMLTRPLTGDMDCLTPTQIILMLETLVNNVKVGNRSAAFFSLGKAYKKVYRGYNERAVLTLGVYGHPAPPSWRNTERLADIFLLKGILELIWQRLGLAGQFALSAMDYPLFQPGLSSTITWGDKTIGVMGELRENLAKDYRFPIIPAFMEVDIEDILAYEQPCPTIVAPSRFPAVSRDLSLIAPRKLAAGKLLERIRELTDGLAESVEMTDLYRGKGIPIDRISYMISIVYRHETRTLTDEEVTDNIGVILNALEKELGVEIRK